MNLRGLNGQRNVHLTEIHVQTPEMAAKSNPGVMLNLQHDNMTKLNESGVDDSKLDWRHIPSTDGTCVCVPDPAGLPYFHGAYDNATYKGRVKFIPPWQQTGSYGPPSNTPVIADHYGNWSTPDKLWPESLGGGWRANPARDRCFDVTSNPNCKPYVKPSLENLVV